MKDTHIVDAILQLSVYPTPVELISEEQQKQFPPFVVISWFWQAALVLCILASFNPSTIGEAVWNNNLFTLRYLLRILITRIYYLPPDAPLMVTNERGYQYLF